MSNNKQTQFQNNKKKYSQKINNYNKWRKIISNKQYHASNEHSLKTARKNRIKKINLILNKTTNINKLNQTNNLLLLDASLVTFAFESN